MGIISRVTRKIQYHILTKSVKHLVSLSDVSLISMNCIAGSFYHDVNAKFLTPTINLFFSADDFIKFVNNLDYYLSLTPSVEMGDEYPIGYLDDIIIYFMHFDSVESALSKWEERKKRVNMDKIFVIMVEQNGFTEDSFNGFKQIKYPKILFTRNPEHQSENVVYFEKYKELKDLPDIIAQREFYKDMKLPKAVSKVYN